VIQIDERIVNINISNNGTLTQISNYMSLKCSISDTTSPNSTEGSKIADIPHDELQATLHPIKLSFAKLLPFYSHL
jgi:hypothetical protein